MPDNSTPPPPAPRRIGDRLVHPIGFGCANLTFHHFADPDRAKSTLQAAQTAGIDLFDTAAAYATPDGAHHNEQLISGILRRTVPAPLIATKGGHRRAGNDFPIDGRPEALRADVDASLRALAVEQIDLYFLHWPDPHVPLAESVAALDELRSAGKLAAIGLSNVNSGQLAAASRTAKIDAVQNPISLFAGGDEKVIADCERHKIALLAYSPLKNLPADAGTSQPLRSISDEHDCSTAQIALAWLLHRSPLIIPLTGATTPEHARSAARAGSIVLTAAEITQLNDLVPAPR